MVIKGICLIANATAIHGATFRQLLPGLLIAGLAIVVLHILFAWLRRKTCPRRSRWSLLEKLVYLVTVTSVAVLGATSFIALLSRGELAGWWLFAHMVGAGMLVAALPCLAIIWADAARFSVARDDASRIAIASPPRFFGWAKAMFWIILGGGLVVTMTMLVSMLPLFGTDGLYVLLDLHRYAGLIIVLATAFHFASVLLRPTESV